MESVIMDGSPLADCLEGVATHQTSPSPQTQPSPYDFAPKGLPARLSRLRDKIPPLNLHRSLTHSPDPEASRRQRRRSHIIPPGRSDFLDQFRYAIVASQLLNSHANTQGYNPRLSLQHVKKSTPVPTKTSYSNAGLIGTAVAAFGLAWYIHFARTILRRQTSWWRLLALALILVAGLVGVYFLGRRQMVGYVRRRTIETVTDYVETAQSLDIASAAAVSLIQEVELVSRGYRISSPLPPVSRIEEQGQVKRCSRLRKVLFTQSHKILVQYRESFDKLREFSVELDLERYFDIYEVSRTDLDNLQLPIEEDPLDAVQTLKMIKSTMQCLHVARKIFLCCLLAMSSSECGGSAIQWAAVNEVLGQLSVLSMTSAGDLDAILSDDAKFSTTSMPHMPREPLSPGHERMRTQLRKFNVLSAGIRELQAKVFLLREDSDRALGAATEDVTDIGARLLEQYDAFGADLRNLMHEWEEGRSALAANINKHEQRLSLSPGAALSFSRSTTPSSLSGITAVGVGSGGSPADALKILNGEVPPAIDTQVHDSSDEELFEAVALPRVRSTLPREERIAKMKEERLRQAAARENLDAGRHMVKELESVIKMRTRPKGLRTSL